MRYYLQLRSRDRKFDYRLQKDKSWRKLDSKTDPISDSDLVSANENVFLEIQEVDKNITLDGVKRKLNPTSATLGSEEDLKSVYYSAYTLRESKPAIPSRSQLASLIEKGDDSKNSLIILNSVGTFEIINPKNIAFAKENPNIIARHEMFVAGNGYLGTEASLDISFVNDIYNESLECWLLNLQANQTNYFADGTMLRRDLNEVIKDIENLIII